MEERIAETALLCQVGDQRRRRTATLRRIAGSVDAAGDARCMMLAARAGWEGSTCGTRRGVVE